MQSIKVFNNNAVSTITKDGREAIIIGSGIGFNKRPGDFIDENRIEKIYYVQNEIQTKFLQMLQNIKPEIMDAAEQIAQMADKAGFTLSNQGIISLIDHISFAIERFNNGLFLPNLMLSETKILYKKEFELGFKALDLIEKFCKIRLPDDEAGYIALHLVSISIDRNAVYHTLKFVKGVFDIIKETYGLNLENETFDVIRLKTHLKFLSQRIFNNESLENDNVSEMYNYFILSNPKNKICIKRVNTYIEQTFNYKLNKQEIVYLLVHLTKIL